MTNITTSSRSLKGHTSLYRPFISSDCICQIATAIHRKHASLGVNGPLFHNLFAMTDCCTNQSSRQAFVTEATKILRQMTTGAISYETSFFVHVTYVYGYIIESYTSTRLYF